MIKLPIDEVLPRFIETLHNNSSVILHAPPGAGKTTRVPLALLEAIPEQNCRIIMLEPRRIAAVSAARWMATCLGEEVGRTVGYSIRFDSRISQSTRIEVVTEGILTRRIQNDPGLVGVDIVIFDEFHERSIHADFGLALCREVQQLRPDLKIIVMSATLDLKPLSRLIGDAPVVSSEGRNFEVKIKYLHDNSRVSISDRVAATVILALKETEGDILAFLPGSGEIRACAAKLSEAGIHRNQVFVCQLYGDLAIAEQQKVLQPGKERKVVLATSIAETSLTIDGVRTVIDSGLTRRLEYDSGNALNRLVTVRESRASAEQRAGRGGRTAPGVCYRLFSPHTFSAMSAHNPPEICVTDLSQLLLELSAWGVSNPRELVWLDAPPVAAEESARRLLVDLDLLQESGCLTDMGREVVRLPLHPRLGRLLFRARELGCTALGCQIAAILSERDIFRRESGNLHVQISGSDIGDRLEALKESRINGNMDSRFDFSAINNVDRVAKHLERLMSVSVSKVDCCADDNISRLLLAAYPDRLARRRESGEGYLLANGRGASLSPRSAVKSSEFIVALALDAGKQADAVIHLAAEISETVIREERCRHIYQETQMKWDEREERVVARRVERVGSIELSVAIVSPDPDKAVSVALESIRASNLALLSFNESVRQFQGRVMAVRSAFPERDWPDVSDAALLLTLEEWLAPHLYGVISARKIAEVNVAEILKQILDYRQQREMDELVPTHLTVPSSSKIKLDYSGEVPVLAVKLQELFGLAVGPMLCNGRLPVLLHLLSPAGRPIQITQDLKGFWDGSYQDVKKELKGRYPRHPWPDDPWLAMPTRRAKARGNPH
jgi:ATP-dependent helicase HrpB